MAEGRTARKLAQAAGATAKLEEGSRRGTRGALKLPRVLIVVLWVCAALVIAELIWPGVSAQSNATDPHVGARVPWNEILTPTLMLFAVFLVAFSGFCSACEVAFFSLHKLTLRTMAESENAADRLVGRLMEHPGSLLTSILMTNNIVNVLLSIVVAAPVEDMFQKSFALPPLFSYLGAISVTTILLVFFGEMLPKIMVVHSSQSFSRIAAPVIFVIDRVLFPIRDVMLFFVGVVFRFTGFSRLKPAPFITDDEFLSLLTQGEATGALEKTEREMIEGIIGYREAVLREILVPRPDIIALKSTATVQEALGIYRDQGYSRMPVYHESLDDVAGTLYAKDLLPLAEEGQYDAPILPLVRKVQYFPETMTVAEFLRAAQKLRMHLAIVVDEYGGTEGLVTLEDALREVIGELAEEDDDEEELIEKIEEGVYRVDGSLSLDALEELTGIEVPDDEHTTIGGFVMERAERIPEVGDEVEYEGMVLTVEDVDGKRVSAVTVRVPGAPTETSVEEAS